MCASWGVSSSKDSKERFRRVSPVAASSSRALSPKAADPHSGQHLVGGPRLRPCVDPSALASEPLPIEEMGASEFGTDRRSAQPIERLSIQAFGGGAGRE